MLLGNKTRPQYFHLLWDEELERLQEVFHMLRQRETNVLNRWYQLYTVHFGEAVTLSQREFMTLYAHDRKQTVTHLLQGDMERFVMDLDATGEQLVKRGVSFREVISSLHLFEESCSVGFDEIPWQDGPSQRISMLLAFDKLSHCRVMVLAETYVGTTQARTQTRTHALEQEVARLAPDVLARQHFHGMVGQCPTM